MGSFQISARLQSRLERVVSGGPEVLSQVVQSFTELKDEDLPVLSMQGLEALLLETQSRDDSYAIAILLVNLLQMKRELGMSSRDVVDQLKSSLADSRNIDDSFLNSFDKISKLLVDLLDMRCISVVEKAVGLTYDYKCLMKGARILTDIRPVFDDDRNEILAGIVSHTMRISFHQDGSEKTFSIALDKEDVEALLTECEKAILKAERSKSFMVESGGTKAIIAGEK